MYMEILKLCDPGEGNTATKASEPNTPVPTPLSSLTSPMGNNVQLFNHANPYVRSFHGNGDGYQPGALLQSYAAFPGILQGMYAHPYHAATQNHHQQQQLPQQQQQQPPSVKAEQQQSQVKAKETSGTTDSDEEGSKLTILSQLCSAVLDHSDAPQKQEPQQRYNDTAAKNPLLSHPSAQTYNASVSSSMTTYPNYATNGTRPNIVYGTPISDTSNAPSPIPHPQHPIYASVNHHQQQTAQQQQQPQQQMWPLPSLQSVVSSDRMYYQQHPLQHNQPGSNDNTTNHWNGANPPHWWYRIVSGKPNQRCLVSCTYPLSAFLLTNPLSSSCTHFFFLFRYRFWPYHFFFMFDPL